MSNCVFTMCMYNMYNHAYSLDPKNRMFPGPWSQKEEVHVSATVCMSAERVEVGWDVGWDVG